MLFDAHMHLGFFADPLGMAQRLEAAGIEVLAATCEPAEYERLAALELGANVKLGVGLHPWWIADGRCGEAEIVRAAELAAQAPYVAEVGLDFRHDGGKSGEQQIATFERLLDAVSNGGHTLSIHAVDAAGEVLDLLEKHGTAANNQIIFHWFSGSSYELLRARRLGCLFSIGPRMLETKRGRSYATQIERDRILLETDLPATPEEGEELTFEEYLEALESAQRIIDGLA